MLFRKNQIHFKYLKEVNYLLFSFSYLVKISKLALIKKIFAAYKLRQSEVYYNASFLSSETVYNKICDNIMNAKEDTKVKFQFYNKLRIFKMLFEKPKQKCVDRESNPELVLGRHQC